MTAQPFAKTPQRQKKKKRKALQRSKGQNTKQPKESFEGIKSVPLKTSQINQRAPRKNTVSQPSQQEPNIQKILSQKCL